MQYWTESGEIPNGGIARLQGRPFFNMGCPFYKCTFYLRFHFIIGIHCGGYNERIVRQVSH